MSWSASIGLKGPGQAVFAALFLASFALPGAGLAEENKATTAPAGAPKVEQKGAPKSVKKRPAKAKPKPTQAVPARPIDIKSDSFEMLPAKNQARWKGHVFVERDNLRIWCDSLLAEQDAQKHLKSLTCEGNVHIVQRPLTAEALEREGWSDRALFENETGILTMTGNPRAREGANTMRGSKVTFDVERDRLVVENAQMMVESSGDLFPARERRDEPPSGADAGADAGADTGGESGDAGVVP